MSSKRRIDIQFQEGEPEAVRLKKLRALVEEISRIPGTAGGRVTGGGSTPGPQGPPGPQGEIGLTGAPGVVQTIVAGTNVTVDDTDPANPIVSASGGGTSVTISDTPPSSPGVGDLWWDSVGGILMVRYDDGDTQQWVSAVPSGSGGGGYSYFPSGWG